MEFEKIAKITVADLYSRGNLKSLDAISEEFGINLTLVSYLRLSEAMTFLVSKKENIPPAIPIGAKALSLSFEKGSQKFNLNML